MTTEAVGYIAYVLGSEGNRIGLLEEDINATPPA